MALRTPKRRIATLKRTLASTLYLVQKLRQKDFWKKNFVIFLQLLPFSNKHQLRIQLQYVQYYFYSYFHDYIQSSIWYGKLILTEVKKKKEIMHSFFFFLKLITFTHMDLSYLLFYSRRNLKSKGGGGGGIAATLFWFLLFTSTCLCVECNI